jgi:hypothetical protein
MGGAGPGGESGMRGAVFAAGGPGGEGGEDPLLEVGFGEVFADQGG